MWRRSIREGLVVGVIAYALILSVIVAGFVVTVFGVGYLTGEIRPLLPWWSIVVANVLATFAGAVYLVWRHPMWRSAPGGHRPAVS